MSRSRTESGGGAAAGTPFWKLVLKQFDDYLVKILIAAAVVDLIIALANGERGAGCVTRLHVSMCSPRRRAATSFAAARLAQPALPLQLLQGG